MRTVVAMMLVLSMAATVWGQRRAGLSYRLVGYYVEKTQKDVGVHDTTAVYPTTTEDYTGTYRRASVYVRTILINWVSGGVFLVLQYKPTGADTLAWFNGDSISVDTAADTNYFYSDSSITIPLCDSIRFIFRPEATIGAGDSLVSWNMTYRLYTLEKGF